MPNYHAISLASHGNKRWLRTTSYAFALKDAVLPLSLVELARAMTTLPIGFIEQSGGFLPAAVMSLQPEKNLFVTPDGRWIHGYIPASVRSYPFRFLKAPDGQQVLCVDEDSGLISDGPEGEAFFDEAGQPAPVIREILAFLHQSEESLKATAAACAILDQHKLIKPWPIKVKTPDGEKQINGLFQIDEAALNQLSADALIEVRNAGGLLIAYSQLLSMQHLQVLGQLADAHAKTEQAAAEAARSIVQKGELNIDFLNKNDTMSFGGFR